MSNGVLISLWWVNICLKRENSSSKTLLETHTALSMGLKILGLLLLLLGVKFPEGHQRASIPTWGFLWTWKVFSPILHSSSQPCRVLGAKMNLSPSEALTALFNSWCSSGNAHLSVLVPQFAGAGHGAGALCGGGCQTQNLIPKEPAGTHTGQQNLQWDFSINWLVQSI